VLGDRHALGVARDGVARKGVGGAGEVSKDSDVYKWLEAAAWEYGRRASPDLIEAQRAVTRVVAAAQQPDGYLDSVVQIRGAGRYQEPPLEPRALLRRSPDAGGGRPGALHR